MRPEEALHGLKKACKAKNKINVIGRAIPDAREYFHLETKVKIYNFICNGLENAEHITTKEWGKDPDRSTTNYAYSFSFYSGDKFGYLSFVYIEKTGFWLIKSFKENTSLDQRNLPFRTHGLIDLRNQLEGDK